MLLYSEDFVGPRPLPTIMVVLLLAYRLQHPRGNY
jgi:hypothetical protein